MTGLPPRLPPGSVFANDFKVVRPLKSGGQGSLYVVEQISTSKQRALKLMLPELVAQPASRKRFELEARIAARIKSDHVVESIASGVDAESGTPWLVMELLEGQDLAAYVQKKKRLPPGEVLEIFSQLCHALGEAHEQGIVHRDLKPDNIFLATARRRGVPFMVKVLDFGIARILAEAQTVSASTTTGLGTPMWMAPEQTVPGGPVGPSTDVWPLGLLAFRLLTGYLFWKAPYDQSASVMMLMAEAFMHPLPTATERAEHYKCRDRLPPGFDEWFGKCVARPMEQRYANAAEAFAALEPILAAAAEATATPAPPSAGPSSTPASRASVTPSPSQAPSSGDPRAATPMSNPLTGPGLATWGGAPEIAAEIVLSASSSKPVTLGTLGPTPVPADGAQPTPGSEPVVAAPLTGADRAPLVAVPARPAGSRTRTVIIAATAAGVLLGFVLFGLQGRSRRSPASPVVASPVEAAVPALLATEAGPKRPRQRRQHSRRRPWIRRRPPRRAARRRLRRVTPATWSALRRATRRASCAGRRAPSASPTPTAAIRRAASGRAAPTRRSRRRTTATASDGRSAPHHTTR